MAEHLVVVEKRSDWKPDFPRARVVTATEYLASDEFGKLRDCKVTNLCRSYSYLSVGYYVSLLAEARRHRVIPSTRTLSELSRKSIYSLDVAELDGLVHRSLKKSAAHTFDMLICFGQSEHPELEDLARQIHEMFPCPLLRVEFKLQADKWRITRIRPYWVNALDEVQHRPFTLAVEHHLSKRWRSRRRRPDSLYDLAILVNPADPLPPSDKRALRNFVRVGKTMGIDVELIEKRDYARLAEYDALFIRDTTRIEHYTYRFSRKAESEGMVVIDDPDSILKCTNKVYLAELLRANRVQTPKTVILDEDGLAALEKEIPYPIVLKIPDGSFSRGVFKVNDRAELEAVSAGLFKESDLILAQEFLYTEFDWRIGILNGTPIYACQYFMSKKHWQILQHKKGGGVAQGAWRTLPIEETPTTVVRTALKAANLIGNGLYGVDLKQTTKGAFVIEVNDNPNLDSGVEDAVLKDELYRAILNEFIRRLEVRKPA
ncbi:MAG: RimK family protein [Xanthomonadaceae bacterium]|nr:RimK family protein [Xanthomonadaceae bacterium]